MHTLKFESITAFSMRVAGGGGDIVHEVRKSSILILNPRLSDLVELMVMGGYGVCMVGRFTGNALRSIGSHGLLHSRRSKMRCPALNCHGDTVEAEIHSRQLRLMMKWKQMEKIKWFNATPLSCLQLSTPSKHTTIYKVVRRKKKKKTILFYSFFFFSSSSLLYI